MSDKVANLNELLNAFNFEGKLANINRINDGHINDTYVFDFTDNKKNHKKYLVQELNVNVFRKPVDLMNNIIGVTHHLKEKVTEYGGDPERECLYLYPAKDGKTYFVDTEGRFWRCFNYVYNAHSVQNAQTPEIFAEAARAFGKFQHYLSDYPIDSLVETIPNFHNTSSRLADFKQAVNDNKSYRADYCRKEIDFILAREKDCGVLVKMIDEGKLPLRVTHNDTKLNNVMFDDETNKAICIVDLDTVMPGLSLYDFGDSIRFGASTAAEDETDLDKVHFDIDYFRAYADGFISTAGKSLTRNEILYLPFSSKLMTLECGMRFLGDYINGDVYFKTDYAEHNLIRARTQLKLVGEMEEAMPEMEKIISEICEKYGVDL